MHFTVSWVNTSVQYNPINFKLFIEKVSNVPLYKHVGSKRRFEITSIEGYETQHLQKKKSNADALVFYKDKDPNRFKNTGATPVTMTMKGRYSLGGLDGNVDIRMFEPRKPKKGQEEQNHSNVTCRISFQNNDTASALVKKDEQIRAYVAYVSDHLNAVMGQKNRKTPVIDALFTSEISLVSPKNGHAFGSVGIPFNQLKKVFKKMDEIVSKKGYSYDKVSNDKDGKKLSGKYFKPILSDGEKNMSKTRPTINVFNTMRVQATGKYTLEQLRPILKLFVDAFNEATKDLRLPTQLKPPDLRERSIAHCRKNTPETKSDGTCSGGRIPKVYKGNVCCYNEILFPGKARKYVQEFKQLGIPIPKAYEKYKDDGWKVEKYKDEKTRRFALRVKIVNGNEVVYKPWNCMKQKVDEIRQVGKDVLKLSMEGKKDDLCRRIERSLNPPPKPQQRRVPAKKRNLMKRKYVQ
jgi:hypothetical protein